MMDAGNDLFQMITINNDNNNNNMFLLVDKSDVIKYPD